jgi:hypothetical protein
MERAVILQTVAGKAQQSSPKHNFAATRAALTFTRVRFVVVVVLVLGCDEIGPRTLRLTSELARADGCAAPISLREVDTLDLGIMWSLYRGQACGRVVYYECVWFGKSAAHECCYPAPAPPAVDMFRFERRDGSCTSGR